MSGQQILSWSIQSARLSVVNFSGHMPAQFIHIQTVRSSILVTLAIILVYLFVNGSMASGVSLDSGIGGNCERD